MAFELGRSEGYPTQYSPNATPVTVDVLEIGLITTFAILAISFFVALPTTRLRTNLIVYARVSVTLLIGAFLLVNNFGQEWEVAYTKSKTPYRAGSAEEINASISIKIALRSVNVTLKATPDPNGTLKYEKIDYNERFEWTWDQGRFGFGPFAGRLQQQFRAAQYRGLPLPILWVMDYFVIDGEGFRYGRFYRTAGWYTHIAMWAAFACWLLTIILFKSVISYGAYTLGMCGLLQLLSNLIWFAVRNPHPLVIPFENGVLETKYGFNYWANFVTGLICIVISGVILYMDYKYDQELYNFFGINPLNSYDAVAYLTKQERLRFKPRANTRFTTSDIPLVEVSNDPHEDDEAEYVPVYLKRRTIVAAPYINRKNKPKRYVPNATEIYT
ncbi:hypothetical protein NQ315_004310 [Exocentrus adspersus]|uniref:Dual oxidase maturation factor 1 n=1 Tax=Exocentrus adspersus TaxID=1586481 RepID=A0AAV8W6W7_9CUCU|nr:hypothetical protein NQ315_004310 [Exocentrus adspersus]